MRRARRSLASDVLDQAPVRMTKRSRVVLETLLPDGAHPILSKGLAGAGFEEFYEGFERRAGRKLLFSFRLSLFVAIWIAPLLIGRIPPITLYGRPTRERALMRFFESRITLFRQIALTMKLVLALCYGADPDVREAIGYPKHLDDVRRFKVTS